MAKEEERGKGERGRDGEKGKVERGKINVDIFYCISLFLDYRVTTLSPPFSKSPTSVDWFILDTDSGDAPRIHKAVDYWAHHIVDQANNMAPSASRSQSVSVHVSLSFFGEPILCTMRSFKRYECIHVLCQIQLVALTNF